ncbi:MAG: hypothetical protein JW729_03055 [Bacteroidales bacterium]|nr:hypothetical protein [Bacteroidales bacterium]
MLVSVEISYYPLQEEFIPPILVFVSRLKTYPEMKVVSNRMSTQVFGEFSVIMKILTKEIEQAFEIPNSVFIIKIINSDQQIHLNTNE